MVLEKTLESPLDCKEIKPVNPKGNQSWIFTGGTDAETETPILWPPDVKNWLIRKNPDAGRDWRQEEKGTTEDENVGWHHRLRWTWVWASSGSWWWTGRPGVLQPIGSPRVGHNWANELRAHSWHSRPYLSPYLIDRQLPQPVRPLLNESTSLTLYFVTYRFPSSTRSRPLVWIVMRASSLSTDISYQPLSFLPLAIHTPFWKHTHTHSLSQSLSHCLSSSFSLSLHLSLFHLLTAVS